MYNIQTVEREVAEIVDENVEQKIIQAVRANITEETNSSCISGALIGNSSCLGWCGSGPGDEMKNKKPVYNVRAVENLGKGRKLETKKSWAMSHDPSPLQAAMWTSYSLHCPSSMVSVN